MKKTVERQIVFNRRILICFFGFALFLLPSISCFQSRDTDLGFFLLAISLLFFALIFLSPLYFVFTKTEITVIWLLQYKRVIPWRAIKSVIELKWGVVHRDLPKYELLYHLNYKGYVVTKEFDIPRNKRTKKLFEKYAKAKII